MCLAIAKLAKAEFVDGQDCNMIKFFTRFNFKRAQVLLKQFDDLQFLMKRNGTTWNRTCIILLLHSTTKRLSLSIITSQVYNCLIRLRHYPCFAAGMGRSLMEQQWFEWSRTSNSPMNCDVVIGMTEYDVSTVSSIVSADQMKLFDGPTLSTWHSWHSGQQCDRSLMWTWQIGQSRQIRTPRFASTTIKWMK